MSVSYKPLKCTLAKMDLSKQDLLNMASLSSTTVAKFAKNEYVSLQVIDRICQALKCDMSDVVEIKIDEVETPADRAQS